MVMQEQALQSDRSHAGTHETGVIDIDVVPPANIETVSLFAGCGGLDLGFMGGFTFRGEDYERLPFRILSAYDNDAKCVETYRKNLGNHISQADLSVLPATEMPAADLLIGGFPCQEFSSCGPRRGLEHETGLLYKVFIKYMEEHSPCVVVAENVPNLKRMDNGLVLETILNDLKVVGYRFEVWVLHAPSYGVPQDRTRIFLVGVRNDLQGHPTQPEMTHALAYRSIDWAIEDLEGITDDSVPNQDQYFRANRAKRGGGQGDEVNRRGRPAYTIRANPKSRVHFHYSLGRRLTIRECARLQTFPDAFVFPHSATANIKQVGNAVPPVLAHHVARSIYSYFTTLNVQRNSLPQQLEPVLTNASST